MPLVAWLELRLLGTTGAGSGLGVTVLLPRSSHTCTLWRALAVEPGLATQVLGLLLEKMSGDVPFKESRAFLLSSAPDRVATLPPLAVSELWGGTPGPSPIPPPRCRSRRLVRGRVAAAGGPLGGWAWVAPCRHLAADWGTGAGELGAQARKGPAGVGPRGSALCFTLWKKNKPSLAACPQYSSCESFLPLLLKHREQMLGARSPPPPPRPHCPGPASCPRAELLVPPTRPPLRRLLLLPGPKTSGDMGYLLRKWGFRLAWVLGCRVQPSLWPASLDLAWGGED